MSSKVVELFNIKQKYYRNVYESCNKIYGRIVKELNKPN